MPNGYGTLTRPQAFAVTRFINSWLSRVVPGIVAVKLTWPTGKVQAKDSLYWRDVGTLPDFIALARALGVIE